MGGFRSFIACLVPDWSRFEGMNRLPVPGSRYWNPISANSNSCSLIVIRVLAPIRAEWSPVNAISIASGSLHESMSLNLANNDIPLSQPRKHLLAF